MKRKYISALLVIIFVILIPTVSANGVETHPSETGGQVNGDPLPLEKVIHSKLGEFTTRYVGESLSVKVPDVDLQVDGLKTVSGITFAIQNVQTENIERSRGAKVEPGNEIFVEPTGSGIKINNTINSGEENASFTYKFDLPDGALIEDSELSFKIIDGEFVRGTFFKTAATDNSGNPVPTTYSWDGYTLTQSVDLRSNSVSFPVSASPTWGYTYQYDLHKAPVHVQQMLQHCFNCYFPVAGAPEAYPYIGQILPLNIVGINFEVKFARTWSAANYYHFYFEATRNHIDGYGSNILFEFKRIGGVQEMHVTAAVVNNSALVNNPIYQAGALAAWLAFVNNLNRA